MPTNSNNDELERRRRGNDAGRHLYTNRNTRRKREEHGRRKWEKKEYEIAIECKIRTEYDDVSRGIYKKVHEYWKAKGMWEIDEKILMNQIRTIIRKKWLTDVEIEVIEKESEGRKGLGGERRTTITSSRGRPNR